RRHRPHVQLFADLLGHSTPSTSRRYSARRHRPQVRPFAESLRTAKVHHRRVTGRRATRHRRCPQGLARRRPGAHHQAHYIDAEFKIKKKIIWFKELEYPHSGLVIEEELLKCLTYWGIKEKVFTLMLDNASNNTAACELLVADCKPDL
ncbi:unnamed protein product, partial [Urochloa humidicola]